MGKKKTGSGLWWIIGIIVLVATVPRQVWIAIGILGTVALVAYVLAKWQAGKKPSAARVQARQGKPGVEPTLAELMSREPPRYVAKTPSSRDVSHRELCSPPPQPPPLPPVGSGTGQSSRYSRAADIEEPEFYSTQLDSRRSAEHTFAIPSPGAGSGTARWVPAGETVSIAGTTLPGGMLYVGARLKAANGQLEPSLISAQHEVARHGDYRQRHTNYWPSYAEITPAGRRAYLNWLAEGRSHPDCDIGLVFLFFYGLERRVILDTAKDGAVKSEWPVIADELRRLLAIYAERSGSFRRYAGELLNWIELDSASSKLYLKPIPAFPQGYELPAYLKLALGQSAVDRAPIPAALALAWLLLNPATQLRTAAKRCPDEFRRLFLQRYAEAHGQGLVLPKNRTRLKVVYQAASPGFRGATISLGFGETPDITALTAPIRSLLAIADRCTDELGPFSRLVGKDPAVRGSFEGLLQLPVTLWPIDAQAGVEKLKSTLQQGAQIKSLHQLLEALGGAGQTLGRDKVRALARSLEESGIGMEPDVLAGARAPNLSEPVVLFALPPSEAAVPDSAAHQAAALTLQLASGLARADGDISDEELQHLHAEIERWNHLTQRSRQRLHAHLTWLTAAPVTLASLKKKLEPLEAKAKQMLAAFMATLAHADGVVTPEEVKFLEKIYKTLGVEPKQIFSDIHAVGAGTAPTARTGDKGFRLDAARIAELERDTVRVSALLSEIFTEEAPAPPVPVVDNEPECEAALLGLDEAHAALVRLMLSRPEWTRAELNDAAVDLELMLDGALEQLNEACFDMHGAPLCEGEDPVIVNAEALEKIEQ